MQGESGHLAHPVVERFVAGRQRLQGEHLAALLRPNGNPIGDRRTQELIHRPRLEALAGQIAGLGIPLQQSPTFQKTADAPCQGLGQCGELGARRRLHRAELD